MLSLLLCRLNYLMLIELTFCVHFSFQLLYLLVVNVIIVIHEFIDSAGWRKLYDTICYSLNKFVVMRRKQDVSSIRFQVVVECLDRFQIQVVGRSVQNQTVRIAELHTGKYLSSLLEWYRRYLLFSECFQEKYLVFS